jgi:hypothetical protein
MRVQSMLALEGAGVSRTFSVLLPCETKECMAPKSMSRVAPLGGRPRGLAIFLLLPVSDGAHSAGEAPSDSRRLAHWGLETPGGEACGGAVDGAGVK